MKYLASAIALLSLAAPLSARDADKVLMPADEETRALYNQFGFAEAIVHGDTVYISGVIVSPVEGLSEEEAYDASWQYIASILERAGSSLDDVIDVTSFHTDLPAQAEAFVASKNRYLTAPYPAWTAIDIDSLFLENGMVEIKVVARLTPTE
jgi:enamine deaminase RidA (YjgF/YER057c/UK114 family)